MKTAVNQSAVNQSEDDQVATDKSIKNRRQTEDLGSEALNSEAYDRETHRKARTKSLRAKKAKRSEAQQGFRSLLPGITRSLKFVLSSLTLLTTYIFLQSLLMTSGGDHPLEAIVARNLFYEFRSDYLTGLLIFTLSLLITVRSKISEKKVIRGLLIASYALALIGPLHWFIDNGHLFWYFAPSNVFVTTRVRWPLVNSNHFGFLLLPGFLISLTFLFDSYMRFQKIFHSQAFSHRKLRKAEILSLQSTQNALGKFFIFAVGSLAIGAALIGTLSRAVWAGTLLGLAALILALFISKYAPAREKPGEKHSEATGPHKKNRRKFRQHERYQEERGIRYFLKRYATATILSLSVALATFSIVILFLGVGAGQERVLSRLAFGLLHTHNDMRFQLYQDSIPLLSLFGIGTSQWNVLYPTVMDQGLAGIHPLYLHSDPLQFLIEYGYIGGLLLLPVVIAPFIMLISQLTNTDNHLDDEESLLLRALFAISIALIIPISFDFPLRIPASLVLAGMLYGVVLKLSARLEDAA